MQELLGSVPLSHVDDACDARIFCMERPSMKGRFIIAAANPTFWEFAGYFRENGLEIKMDEM
uniref:Dihydroflavonol-4-reductase-like isoform X2 n=1 Tax=Rhizophora mucronata TaxID=61149 RepID=A0A2P2QY68_RHIMU